MDTLLVVVGILLIVGTVTAIKIEIDRRRKPSMDSLPSKGLAKRILASAGGEQPFLTAVTVLRHVRSSVRFSAPVESWLT